MSVWNSVKAYHKGICCKDVGRVFGHAREVWLNLARISNHRRHRPQKSYWSGCYCDYVAKFRQVKKFRSDLRLQSFEDHEDLEGGNPRPRIHAFLVSLACDQSNPESIKKRVKSLKNGKKSKLLMLEKRGKSDSTVFENKQKMSHFTLRAKRATLHFEMFFKNAKNGQF